MPAADQTTSTRESLPDQSVTRHVVDLSTAAGRQEKPNARSSASGRELRRARIVITVRRTENYKQWLKENPLQAMIASEGSEGGEDGEVGMGASTTTTHSNLKQG